MTRLIDRPGVHELAPGLLASIVTYLEMTAPPPPRPVPDLPGVELVRIARPDLAWYRRLFTRVGAPWLWYSRLKMSDTALAAILGDPGTEVWVPMRGGEELGLLELDRRAAADVELAFFGLVPEAVGGGLGRWLMDKAIGLAWADPRTRRFHVHTCDLDHPAARMFYVRSGFRPYRYAVDVDHDPRLGPLPPDIRPDVPLIRG
jgi:GNAT superfamily N-acetyltransferase